MRKYALKTRQIALRSLAQHAKSLTGSDKLHPPIIMREEPKGKDGKKEELKEEKKSGKAIELIEKNKAAEAEKVRSQDKTRFQEWEPNLEKIAEIQDVDKLSDKLLDTVVGFSRITDSFVGFAV